MIECLHCGYVRRARRNSCPKCGHLDMEVVRSIQIAPSATPTSMNTIPPRRPNNSFEKGTRTDERGLAYLDKDGRPLKMKESFDKRLYGGRESIKVNAGGNS